MATKAKKPSIKSTPLRRTERGVLIRGEIPAELERRFRVLCAEQRWSNGYAIEQAIELLLKKHGR